MDRVVDELHRLEESPCGTGLKIRDWRSCFLFVYNGEKGSARACAREKGSAGAGEIDRSREENGGRRSIEHGWCGYYATEVGSHILELLGWRIVR